VLLKILVALPVQSLPFDATPMENNFHCKKDNQARKNTSKNPCRNGIFKTNIFQDNKPQAKHLR